jgi:PPOX class probable F420-dependent enzyme
MSTTMTVAERQAFLADVHVGVLALTRPGGRGPLNVPVWYDYTPGGELWFITEPDSRKGRLLQVGTLVSLCVQTETAPYQYVSVEGDVVAIEPAKVEEHLRPMARRYLGVSQGDLYAAGSEDGDSALVRVRPLHWLSVDYRKR